MRAVQFIKIAAVALAGMAFSAGPYGPSTRSPSKAANFRGAQAAGKPLLVDVFAPWCPVCKAQQAVLGGLKHDRQVRQTSRC